VSRSEHFLLLPKTRAKTMQAQRSGTARRGDEENAGCEAIVATFRVVEDLQSAGINASDIKKLQEAGLSTIGQVLQTSSRDLIGIKGFSEAKVDKIREAARKLDPRGGVFKVHFLPLVL
jgi:predicted RecB family nuclease